MNKLNRLFKFIKGSVIRKLSYINVDLYMRTYVRYLRGLGISFSGQPKYISPDVYFDGNDYTKIIIGDNVTISREVMLLTHDYSITTALASIGRVLKRHEGEIYFSRGITIGDNCFIGARASLLPGAKIGNNVIIGACSTVKGNIEDNSIVIGNPCRVIANTKEWALMQYGKKEFHTESG